MTMPATYTPAVHHTNGVTVAFAFTFPALSTTYIKVYSRDLVTEALTELTTGFTVTENATKTAGTVTFVVAPDDMDLVIKRETPQSQAVSLETSKGFSAKVIEAMVDKVTAMVQERFEELERSLSYPAGTSSSISAEIPAPQAGLGIKGNADADGWIATTYDPDEQVTLATAQAVIATTQAGTATTARIGAETAEAKAEEWAEKAEDSEVETGKYSAKHWAAKAEGFAETVDTQAIKSALMPVGTIYSNKTDNRNPSVIFGFTSTWEAVEGVVIAGYKSGDANFGTAGATVGAATVTLTGAQSGVPVHGHPMRVSSGSSIDGSGGMTLENGSVSSYNAYTGSPDNTRGHQVGGNTAANAAEAHTNIQPTLVCYTWLRTA